VGSTETIADERQVPALTPRRDHPTRLPRDWDADAERAPDAGRGKQHRPPRD
jgi:hypothetical protein